MKKPIVVAHRGLHVDHVENTLGAVRAAWNAGFTWAEIDVRGSAEHEPFLMHDEMLDRTTKGVGPISETPAKVLKKLGVPSLAEACAAMPAGVKLLVEIKPKQHEEMVRKTLEVCDPSRCVIQSFDADLLRRAGELRADYQLHLLIEDPKSPQGGPWESINVYHNALDVASIQSIRNMGFRVGAWTVNDKVDIERIAALNVDMMTSDQPLLARDICSKIG